MRYYRYDMYFGSLYEITEKEFNRRIKSKYVFPVWDSYYQECSKNTYYDSRDSIIRIFYFRKDEK